MHTVVSLSQIIRCTRWKY